MALKCIDVIKALQGMAVGQVGEHTCDTVKSGDPEREITKAAFTMFATPAVVRAASEWGAQLLMVHEPTYYNHMDHKSDYKIAEKKEKLIADSGIVIARLHDYAHSFEPDLIFEGQTEYLGLPGTREKGRYFGVNRFILDEEITAAELAAAIEKNWNIRHVRLVGDPETKGRNIGCCFGTPGHVGTMVEENEFVITGEICEWAEGEMVRDCAELGIPKALLVVGHIGSERCGMRLLADKTAEAFPQIECRYFECGEVFTYVS